MYFYQRGYKRYWPVSWDAWLPWSVYDQLSIDGAVPILGHNHLRPNSQTAWHLGPTPQYPHSYRYRIKKAICENDIRELSIAMKHVDPDVNVNFEGTLPALSLIANLNSVEMLAYLIMLGADPNKKDKHGQTPLMHAVNSQSFDCAKMLIRYGANIHEPDHSGITPYQKAKLKKFKPMLFLFERHERAPVTKKVMDVVVRNPRLEEIRKLERVFRHAKLKQYGPVLKYPFNDMKGVYSLTIRNEQFHDFVKSE